MRRNTHWVVAAIAAVVTLHTACAAAQPRYVWNNSQLRASVTQEAQYEAIFRGNIAECQAHATTVASSAYPPPAARQPSGYQISGSVNGQPFVGYANSSGPYGYSGVDAS